MAVVALALYTQVKSTDESAAKTRISDRPSEGPNVNLLMAGADGGSPIALDGAPSGSSEERGGGGKKCLGFTLAIAAGLLFGNTFTPPNYLMDNHLGPKDPLDYVFSHYCGIFATSTLW